jgi:hypothetical protein
LHGYDKVAGRKKGCTGRAKVAARRERSRVPPRLVRIDGEQGERSSAGRSLQHPVEYEDLRPPACTAGVAGGEFDGLLPVRCHHDGHLAPTDESPGAHQRIVPYFRKRVIHADDPRTLRARPIGMTHEGHPYASFGKEARTRDGKGRLARSPQRRPTDCDHRHPMRQGERSRDLGQADLERTSPGACRCACEGASERTPFQRQS